ncbi:hypothetical protein JRI60_29350 [Archangium violaceum]|uniref:hypothetical protein n=1 Tax=Archangium violaceum TaxID=83451 RepID=UPI0019525FE4|nr:hypothetical protein [Archangium violaceum]QRN93296.1 hypothetical protein JRI60_29350 [Archangium violaceum]
MVRLKGPQWGLVALVAGTPFFLAFLLAAVSPALLEPVFGTVLGGACWLLAALLGLLGGALFAGFLGSLAQVPGFATSRPRQTLGFICAALVSVALCIVPATCLLLAGPALAVRFERGEVETGGERLRTPLDLAQRLRQQVPRVIPNLPRMELR